MAVKSFFKSDLVVYLLQTNNHSLYNINNEDGVKIWNLIDDVDLLCFDVKEKTHFHI